MRNSFSKCAYVAVRLRNYLTKPTHVYTHNTIPWVRQSIFCEKFSILWSYATVTVDTFPIHCFSWTVLIYNFSDGLFLCFIFSTHTWKMCVCFIVSVMRRNTSLNRVNLQSIQEPTTWTVLNQALTAIVKTYFDN